jgi:predicted acylesterase/phospholipase RssA
MSYELIISSGGSKGVAIVGALNEFVKYSSLNNIKYYTGCSIGAIISLMLIIGYSIEELNDIIFKINLAQFQDLKIKNLIEKCGFDEGIRFTNFLKAIIINKNFESNITFQELFEKTGKILTIATTNITKGIINYYNVENNPNMQILTGLRMSSNVPILFSPLFYNDNYYLDGGLLDPYPYFYIKNTKKYGIWLFENDEFSFIKNLETNFIDSTDNSLGFVLNLLKIMYYNYMKKFYKKIPKNTIYIDFTYSNISFDMNIEDRKKMFEIGIKKTKSYFKRKYKNARKKYLSQKYFYIWNRKTKINNKIV